MRIPGYQKIPALGSRYVSDVFDGIVEITEKLDGSMFAFGKIDGQLLMRSKNSDIFLGSEPKDFSPAVRHVQSIADAIPDGMAFYSETLARPRHNTLRYERVPTNHIAMFGAKYISDGEFVVDGLDRYAELFDVDVAPVLFVGKLKGIEEAMAYMDGESFYGGEKEGIVVKNYGKDFVYPGGMYPVVVAKLVSERFKEVHGSTWKKEKTKSGRLESLYESYRSEARWSKAVRHLTDEGVLSGTPSDIGKIIACVKKDIGEEESENIAEALYSIFSGDLLRVSVRGLPEWYKDKIGAI